MFYEKKSGKKIDFTHILAKIYTTPFACRHFNTADRMIYIVKTIYIINPFPSSISATHARMHASSRPNIGIKHGIMRRIKYGAILPVWVTWISIEYAQCYNAKESGMSK